MISLAEFAAAASGGCAVVALAEWAQMSVERRAGAASSPAPDASGQRRRLLEAELPVVADRILLAVRAGLPLGRALSGAGEHGRGLLALELGLADARVRLGASRAEALAQLERSCPLPEVVALVAAIGRADRYGVALEPMLAALAAGARADRQRRITEQAQGAAPKIQLIVALLLVPAAICCVAAGMIAGLGGS